MGQKAGTTKGIQWIKVQNLMVLDSPGVVPGKDHEVELALLGAKDAAKLKNREKACYAVIKMFLDLDKKPLEEKYGIEIQKDDDEEIVVEKIAESKGYLRKGGVADEQRVYFTVIRDWQIGKLRF